MNLALFDVFYVIWLVNYVPINSITYCPDCQACNSETKCWKILCFSNFLYFNRLLWPCNLLPWVFWRIMRKLDSNNRLHNHFSRFQYGCFWTSLFCLFCFNPLRLVLINYMFAFWFLHSVLINYTMFQSIICIIFWNWG